MVVTFFIITFPAPQQIPENYYATIVTSFPVDIAGKDSHKMSEEEMVKLIIGEIAMAPVRYFTLEKTFQEKETGNDDELAVFGEWQGSNHINYGTLKISKKSFQNAVIEKLQEK
jgi:hypothetical protein